MSKKESIKRNDISHLFSKSIKITSPIILKRHLNLDCYSFFLPVPPQEEQVSDPPRTS
jgi:hypothetical protein